jgi:lysozyme
MSVDFDKLKAQISVEEGRKGKVYPDPRGVPTIGIGRNLRDVGLSDDEIDYLFKNDILRVTNDIAKNIPWVFGLDDVRQRVFFDLVFNMGITKLLTFQHTLALAKAGDFAGAADELHHSLWDSQVGNRAPKLEAMLKTGVDQ